MSNIKELAARYTDEMIATRRHLHRHPELGGKEEKTVAYIADRLRDIGLVPNTNYSQHACSAVLEGKKGGKVIMLRADIDALPIKEESGVLFASENEGVMHACGHDVHTSALLGAARILWDMRDELNGSVKFCFQPAEEIKGIGACIMVEDGILENPKVDFVMGAHVTPSLPVGTVTAEAGPASAYPDSFSLTVTGVGCHGSAPQNGKDPIRAAVVAYGMINDLTAKIDALEPHLIQVCALNAGSVFNIIPATATLGGTVRTLTPKSRELCRQGLLQVCRAVEEGYGVKCELSGFGAATPPVVNDPAYAPLGQASLRKVAPRMVTFNADLLGGEDFSFYEQTGIPGFFVRYGVSNEDEATHFPLHSPRFCPDESAIPLAASIYAQVALDYLNGQD